MLRHTEMPNVEIFDIEPHRTAATAPSQWQLVRRGSLLLILSVPACVLASMAISIPTTTSARLTNVGPQAYVTALWRNAAMLSSSTCVSTSEGPCLIAHGRAHLEQSPICEHFGGFCGFVPVTLPSGTELPADIHVVTGSRTLWNLIVAR